jgi:hypothetical protein
MSLVRKSGLMLALGGVAAGGLVALSAPANAAGSLECDPSTVRGQNYAVCFLTGTANPSNAKWTYNQTYESSFDNQTSVRFPCGATGSQYRVSVTFTSTSGPASASASGACGGKPV